MTVTYRNGRNKVYCLSINPFGCLDDSLQVDDLVLIKEDGHNEDFPILMVYNDEEESRLRALGVPLPDGPPDLHPHGYYG